MTWVFQTSNHTHSDIPPYKTIQPNHSQIYDPVCAILIQTMVITLTEQSRLVSLVIKSKTNLNILRMWSFK